GALPPDPRPRTSLGEKTTCAIADVVSLMLTPGKPSLVARFVPKSIGEKTRPQRFRPKRASFSQRGLKVCVSLSERLWVRIKPLPLPVVAPASPWGSEAGRNCSDRSKL